MVLGSVAALGATGGGGGLTLSPGLWLKTSPAGIVIGFGGMGGGGFAVWLGPVVVTETCGSDAVAVITVVVTGSFA